MAKGSVDIEAKLHVSMALEVGERWSVLYEILSGNGSHYGREVEGDLLEYDSYGIRLAWRGEGGRRMQKFIPWSRIYEMDLVEGV